MPMYIYEGPGTSLSIAGRTLDRGQPMVLESRAADAAEAHPEVRAIGTSDRKAAESGHAPTGLEHYKALKARAKELGIPATGKAETLAAAITAEESRIAVEGGAG